MAGVVDWARRGLAAALLAVIALPLTVRALLRPPPPPTGPHRVASVQLRCAAEGFRYRVFYPAATRARESGRWLPPGPAYVAGFGQFLGMSVTASRYPV